MRQLGLHSPSRSPLLAGLLLCLFAGCSFDVGFDPENATFQCRDGSCPEGLICNDNNFCVSPNPPTDISQNDLDVHTGDIPAPKDTHVPGDTDVTIQTDLPSPKELAETSEVVTTDTSQDTGGPLDTCGGITVKGCCGFENGVSAAFTCSNSMEVQSAVCTQDGQVCGWSTMGFYACGEEGFAGPDDGFPFLCPGESCTPDCDGKECQADGCGNPCGCTDENAACVEGSCECKDGFEENAQGCTELPFECPGICSSCGDDTLCIIDCDVHKANDKDFCKEEIECPPGMSCHIICNENDTCSKGITADATVLELEVLCDKDHSCRGPIDSLAATTRVHCEDDKSCRNCPDGESKCTEGFGLTCAGEQCDLICEKNGNPNSALNGKCQGSKICSAKACNFTCSAKWSCSGEISCQQLDLSDPTSCNIECGLQGEQSPNNACKASIQISGSDSVAINCWSPQNCDSIQIDDATNVTVNCANESSCLVGPLNEDILGPNGLRCQATESCTISCGGNNSCASILVHETPEATVNCSGVNSCKGSAMCNELSSSCTYNCGGNNSCQGNLECRDTPNCNLICAHQNACTGGTYHCAGAGSCHIFPDQSSGASLIKAQNKLLYFEGIDTPLDDLIPSQCVGDQCAVEKGCCIEDDVFFSCCQWQQVTGTD